MLQQKHVFLCNRWLAISPNVKFSHVLDGLGSIRIEQANRKQRKSLDENKIKIYSQRSDLAASSPQDKPALSKMQLAMRRKYQGNTFCHKRALGVGEWRIGGRFFHIFRRSELCFLQSHMFKEWFLNIPEAARWCVKRVLREWLTGGRPRASEPRGNLP